MRVTITVRSCTACNGAGKLKPDARHCEKCGGTGRKVICQGCGDEMLEAEFAKHGNYCTGCRAELDAAEKLEAEEAEAS